MPMDTKRMNQKREQVRRTSGRGAGGDLWTIKEGEWLVFVHGQTYPDDDNELTRGYNFIEVVQHYGVGGKRGGRMCLDPTVNPAILHPIVQEFLAKRKNSFKVTEDTRCPVDDGISAGEISGADAERQTGQTKWLFGVTPMFFRADSNDDWAKVKFEPRVLIAGIQIFNQLTGKIIDMAPADPTDPNAATLFKVVRTGSGFGDTEYEIDVHTPTVREPLRLDKAQRKAVEEATKPGGSCDLFRVLANLMSSPTALKAQMAGVAVDESDASEDADDGKRDCFGQDWADDDECRACPDSDECREACGGAGKGAGGAEPANDREPADDESADDDAGGDDGDRERPPCYGDYEADDTGCRRCEIAGDCEVATQNADAEQADMAGAADGDEPEPEPTGGEGEDPALARMEEEAARLASEKRGGRGKAGTRGKTGKSGKGK